MTTEQKLAAYNAARYEPTTASAQVPNPASSVMPMPQASYGQQVPYQNIFGVQSSPTTSYKAFQSPSLPTSYGQQQMPQQMAMPPPQQTPQQMAMPPPQQTPQQMAMPPFPAFGAPVAGQANAAVYGQQQMALPPAGGGFTPYKDDSVPPLLYNVSRLKEEELVQYNPNMLASKVDNVKKGVLGAALYGCGLAAHALEAGVGYVRDTANSGSGDVSDKRQKTAPPSDAKSVPNAMHMLFGMPKVGAMNTTVSDPSTVLATPLGTPIAPAAQAVTGGTGGVGGVGGFTMINRGVEQNQRLQQEADAAHAANVREHEAFFAEKQALMAVQKQNMEVQKQLDAHMQALEQKRVNIELHQKDLKAQFEKLAQEQHLLKQGQADLANARQQLDHEKSLLVEQSRLASVSVVRPSYANSHAVVVLKKTVSVVSDGVVVDNAERLAALVVQMDNVVTGMKDMLREHAMSDVVQKPDLYSGFQGLVSASAITHLTILSILSSAQGAYKKTPELMQLTKNILKTIMLAPEYASVRHDIALSIGAQFWISGHIVDETQMTDESVFAGIVYHAIKMMLGADAAVKTASFAATFIESEKVKGWTATPENLVFLVDVVENFMVRDNFAALGGGGGGGGNGAAAAVGNGAAAAVGNGAAAKATRAKATPKAPAAGAKKRVSKKASDKMDVDAAGGDAAGGDAAGGDPAGGDPAGVAGGEVVVAAVNVGEAAVDEGNPGGMQV